MEATGKVVVLQPQDRVRQDASPVAAIYRDMGTLAAEQVVTRALGELALTMSDLSAQVRAHDLADVPRQARRLQRMADQLGLVSLGAVSGDLRRTLDQGDATAFAAVWARLIRIAERSLAPGRDLLDQTV